MPQREFCAEVNHDIIHKILSNDPSCAMHDIAEIWTENSSNEFFSGAVPPQAEWPLNEVLSPGKQASHDGSK